ncbi:LysM peptidoglycan-binding domain-containing protein [Microvirga sp. 2TAF3]|uniref:LysM peptidoglycan-binding domain-containing protein n=1 Tax=Microvirga sp. 2TAF3 TaxID=3233014 RepID=UPI003F9452CE
MADERQGRGTIAILGAAAVAVVVVLVGVLIWENEEAPWDTGRTPQARQGQEKAPPGSPEAPAKPQAQTAQNGSPQAPTQASPAPKPAAETKAAGEPIAPSFDIVRVEPNGESVIAGRAAPGATIELLRDDQVHARGVADASGLFAITPPPLPVGSHQIALQSIAPDGKRQRSRESVTVAINGNARPLVALTAPDKPTVLLSNPEPPTPKAAEAAPSQPRPQEQADATSPATPSPASPPPAQPAPRAEIKIMSVEAEQGKLYVSGQAAPGATVRLYLNETFVAPGGAGGDGKLSFAIGSGVKPGDYRVRLDDVDPVSGQVKSRAEVAFNVPADAGTAQMAQNPSQPATPGPETATKPPVPAGSEAPATGSRMASALPEGQSLPSTVVVPNINTAIVSRGDSLWRISQRIYGHGVRYTVIYGANQEQIRNPNLIYPGQVFVLPGDQAKTTH